MLNPDAYDDPKVEEAWCDQCRAVVKDYMRAAGVKHGQIGEWPSWHLAPYASIWAVESGERRGYVGWWVFVGDGPTDYLSAGGLDTPRDALSALADQWNSVAECMEKGVEHPSISIGDPDSWPTLAPMLRERAEMLREISADDENWDY